MIDNIKIQNFKSLADISLSLKQLNVFTGINGMGKSSLIQSLLLLRQAYTTPGYGSTVPLYGNLTGNLGEFSDVLFKNAGKDEIAFEITVDGYPFEWKFIKSEIKDILSGQAPADIHIEIPLFTWEKCQYLSAGRITPSNRFGKSGQALKFRQFGISGEYSIQYLHEKGNEENALFSVATDDAGKALPLIGQVNYWLKKISPNVSLDIRPSAGYEYELRYQYFNPSRGPVSFSAINSPFGLTYALPIIAAILASKKGDLLIIENPESDLHPKAQSLIGQMLARAARCGVQIIIETHSDHILNGICLGVHGKQLVNDAVKIYYFYKNDGEFQTTWGEVIVQEQGRMDDRAMRKEGVEGFFDQAQNDLRTILFNKPGHENLSE